MDLRFTPLRSIASAELLRLLNDSRVLRHMPLAGAGFDQAGCRAWAEGKDRHWQDHGYGPWAILLHRRFVGWGGFQAEQGEPDLALVLLPKFWGQGRAIARVLINRGFHELGFTSITALLPPSRGRARALRDMGFSAVDTIEVDGQPFHRYRLCAGSTEENPCGKKH